MSKKLNLTPDPARSFRTPGGVLVSYVVITPEMATVILEANTKNRSVSDRQVAQYARSLDNNDWPFTGDALRLGPDGLVLDGQHRLLAIERTDKPMECLVVSDLDAVVQRYLDSGRKRTASDQAKLDGVANASNATSIARALLSWAHWRAGKGAITPGNAEVTEYLLENIGQIQESVRVGFEIRANVRRVSLSAVGAAYARAIQVTGDPFLVANFFSKLATGEDLKLGQPLHTLRNTFIRSDQANQLIQLYQIVRAWNAHQLNEPLGKMQLPRGGVTVAKFPDMVAPRRNESPTTLDEEVADALEKLAESEKATHAA